MDELPFFINYRRLNSRQRQISASWTKNKRRGLLANQPRLLPGGQRGPVPRVPWDGSPVRVHHDLRGRLPARPPLRPPQQLGWDQARCSEVCLWDQVCFGIIRSCSCRLQLQIHLFQLLMHFFVLNIAVLLWRKRITCLPSIVHEIDEGRTYWLLYTLPPTCP